MDNKSVTIDGIEYVPAAPKGKRAVVVIDRGWIAAGDVSEENGRIHLSRAVWVFGWKTVGFNAIIDDPSKADIRPFPNGFNVPAASEIFRVPVKDDWGL